jgi:hypothetical protein
MDVDEDDKLVDELARLIHDLLSFSDSLNIVCTPFSSDDVVDKHSSRLFSDFPVIVHVDVFDSDILRF